MKTTLPLLALVLLPSIATATVATKDRTGPQRPEEIRLPYDPTVPDRHADIAEEAEALLRHYDAATRIAVIGQVLTTRESGPMEPPHTVVTMLVERQVRGEADMLLEFRVDPPSSDPQAPPPQFITGYQVMALVDKSGWLVDGNALYAIEGGWAWRNRRPDIFLKPSVDRDWVGGMNPHDHYIALKMEEVTTSLEGKQRLRRGTR